MLVLQFRPPLRHRHRRRPVLLRCQRRERAPSPGSIARRAHVRVRGVLVLSPLDARGRPVVVGARRAVTRVSSTRPAKVRVRGVLVLVPQEARGRPVAARARAVGGRGGGERADVRGRVVRFFARVVALGGTRRSCRRRVKAGATRGVAAFAQSQRRPQAAQQRGRRGARRRRHHRLSPPVYRRGPGAVRDKRWLTLPSPWPPSVRGVRRAVRSPCAPRAPAQQCAGRRTENSGPRWSRCAGTRPAPRATPGSGPRARTRASRGRRRTSSRRERRERLRGERARERVGTAPARAARVCAAPCW